MDVPHLFTHSCADGHLSFFHHSAIVNNAAVNIGVQISLNTLVYKHVYAITFSLGVYIF